MNIKINLNLSQSSRPRGAAPTTLYQLRDENQMKKKMTVEGEIFTIKGQLLQEELSWFRVNSS